MTPLAAGGGYNMNTTEQIQANCAKIERNCKIARRNIDLSIGLFILAGVIHILKAV